MKKLFLLLISLLLLFSCEKKDSTFSVELIAHAGGEINGNVYTNSREALEKSISDGYRYIEFDFSFTADSVLVATHDWELFNKQTGYEHKADTAPTFIEFSQRRIYNRYTPLSAADINDIFEKDTTLILVTDKVSSPAVLMHNFPHLKERMVVEAFSYDDYASLKKEKYFRVFYSCLARDLSEAIVKHLLFHSLFKGDRIEWITMYVDELNNNLFRVVDALSSFKIALFVINDFDSIPDKHRDKVKMIYTENIKP